MTAAGPPAVRRRSAALAEELRRTIAALTEEFTSSLTHLDRELRQLRDAAEGLKLIPVDSVLMALKRIARDAARALGKQVTFEASGGDIRLDAGILGSIQGALIQLVRNAVAHGIETEAQRIAAGKPAAGLVTVNVVRRGARVLFECRDDGRGIDLAAVRRAAIASGVLSSSATEPASEELVRILLRGGVSTSAAVTDVAGRGVGLDVVREAMERLGGDISVNIDPGRGTAFVLSIPSSITSIPVLLVEAGNGESTMAIPLDAVRQSLRLAPGDIARAAAGASILHEQHAVPFIPLAAALDSSRWSVGRGWTAIVIAGSGCVGAIGVERLVGTARMIARPLPAHLKSSPLAVGAALDGEGHPQLILDPDGLIAAAHGARAAEPHAAPSRRPVLVIDDSLTTRMLEKSILESAGYEVDVASCAEDGLDFAAAQVLCPDPLRRRNAGHGRFHFRRTASLRPGAPQHAGDSRDVALGAGRPRTRPGCRRSRLHRQERIQSGRASGHDPADGGLTVVSNTIRVLVVEDSMTVRKRLVGVLDGDPNIEVVGEAGDGRRAIELCLQARPDVITMDMMMPVMNGLAATEYIMAHCPTPILVVSASINRGELFKIYEALAAGAVDVLEKPDGLEPDGNWQRRFLAAVKLVARIRVITHPRARLTGMASERTGPATPAKETERANRVFDLVAIGASTGGPGAILKVLRDLPPQFSLPILLVLHIGEPFGSAFADWLDGQVNRSVGFAQDGMAVMAAAGRVVVWRRATGI